MGLRSVFWTSCLEAHLHLGTNEAADHVARTSSPGDIILCHDGGTLDGPNPQHLDRTRSVQALPHLLDQLLTRGLVPRSLCESPAA
jgi:hypothetical protein